MDDDKGITQKEEKTKASIPSTMAATEGQKTEPQENR